MLVNTVLYNPGAALHIMETIRPGTSRHFFDKWFEAINSTSAVVSKKTGSVSTKEDKLPRVHDKKLTIMALCALLEMDPVQIQDPVKEGWPNIVAGALHVFRGLPDAVAGMLLAYVL